MLFVIHIAPQQLNKFFEAIWAVGPLMGLMAHWVWKVGNNLLQKNYLDISLAFICNYFHEEAFEESLGSFAAPGWRVFFFFWLLI